MHGEGVDRARLSTRCKLPGDPPPPPACRGPCSLCLPAKSMFPACAVSTQAPKHHRLRIRQPETTYLVKRDQSDARDLSSRAAPTGVTNCKL
jgi:hypothetical protein